MYVDQFTYNCNTFEDDLLESRKELFQKRQFADVTLVSDDLVPFAAHRTVLSSSSKATSIPPSPEMAYSSFCR